MREAFSGLFIIRLLLVFIFIYLVFAAISYNYAQAFRLKNSLITYLEEQDIADFNKMYNAGDGEILSGIDDILELSTYRITCTNGDGMIATEDPLDPQKFCYHGVVVSAEEKGNIINYNVSTFVYWNLPLLNTFIMHASNSTNVGTVENAAWEISGNAKVMKRIDPEEQKETTSQEILDNYKQNYINSHKNDSGLSNNSNITIDNDSNDSNNGNFNNNNAGITNNSNDNINNNNNEESTSEENNKEEKPIIIHDNPGIKDYALNISEFNRRHPKREMEDYCERYGQKYVNHRIAQIDQIPIPRGGGNIIMNLFEVTEIVCR